MNVWQIACGETGRRYDDLFLKHDVMFYVYERSADGWAERPVGYLNVFKIRERHVCPANTDAIDTIMSLTPARVAR